MGSLFSRQASASRGLLALLAFHVASEFYRLPRKPPVTAALIAVNTLIYTRLGVLNSLLPSLDEVSFNPHLILQYGEGKRLMLSPFYHMTDSHLVYNMISLLWKGVRLESSMGSWDFASMVGVLVVLSQGCTLLLSKTLLLLGDPSPYYSHYSVGFSGVLFSLKVILNSYSRDPISVHGILLPPSHAAWGELILVQMFVPGVSFLGHLGGILAGLLYLKLRGMYPGSAPIAAVFNGVAGLLARAVSWPIRALEGAARRGRGRGLQWECGACTYHNPGMLQVCEMCGSGRDGSEEVGSPRWVSREEMRLRRVQRFGGQG